MFFYLIYGMCLFTMFVFCSCVVCSDTKLAKTKPKRDLGCGIFDTFFFINFTLTFLGDWEGFKKVQEGFKIVQ